MLKYTNSKSINNIDKNYINYSVNDIVKNSHNNSVDWTELSSLYISEPFLISLLLFENYPDFINNLRINDKKKIYLHISDNFSLYDFLSTKVINDQNWDI